MPPASLTCLPHRFQRRLPRAIPIGIRMKEWVHQWLQFQLHHHLRSDPKRSVCPVSFLHHSPSVSSPCAPVAESNCPMTSDSRSYRDFSSISSQSLQSTVRRPLPLLYSLLLAYTLPRPPTSK